MKVQGSLQGEVMTMNNNIQGKTLLFAVAGALVFLTTVGLAADAGTSPSAGAAALQASSGKLDNAKMILDDVAIQSRAGTTYAAAGPVAVLPINNSAANVETASGTEALSLQAFGSKLDDVKIKIGDVYVHPHLGTSFTYDDNLTISSGGSQQGDFYALVSPGVQFQYGKGENTISLDYQAGIQRFFRLNSMNTVDHNVMLTGTFAPIEKLRMHVAQGFSRATGGESRDQFGSPTGQIGERIPGTRTEIVNYTTALGAEYDISQKTAIGADFTMSISDYTNPPGLVGNTSYDVRVPFYYHLSSKTDLFLGADGGASSVDRGASSTYGGFDVGARTRLTGKINGSVRVGYQHRDFDGGGISSIDTVVATASADWAITHHTTLAASINRGVTPAASTINNYIESTMLDLSVHHKLWHDKITFSAGAGYERDDYGQPFATFTGSGATGSRSDDYYYLKAGCDYAIRKWWSAGANYRFRSSVSSLAAYDFDNNMVSIYTRVSF